MKIEIVTGLHQPLISTVLPHSEKRQVRTSLARAVEPRTRYTENGNTLACKRRMRQKMQKNWQRESSPSSVDKVLEDAVVLASSQMHQA
jgi:hypothetical protein